MPHNVNIARSRHPQQGFSLVEMMIGMVLGLIIMLAAGGSFVASQKINSTTSALSKNQEASQLAFEMMAKDMRVAGPNPCASSVVPVVILNGGLANAWWTQWMDGIRGYAGGTASPGMAFGTGVGARKSGTAAIDIYTADDNVVNIAAAMATSNAGIVLQTGAGARFKKNDILVACDTSYGFVFQVSSVVSNTLMHISSSGAPGNCSGALSVTDPCTSTADGHVFNTDGQVGRAATYRWYLGKNAAGTTSLWRARLTNTTTSAVPSVVSQQEIARDVDTLDITYFIKGGNGYVASSAVSDWKTVGSVRVAIGLKQEISKSMGSGERDLIASTSQVISIRNRQ